MRQTLGDSLQAAPAEQSPAGGRPQVQFRVSSVGFIVWGCWFIALRLRVEKIFGGEG